MKEKILSSLKTKYPNLGFGDKAFDGVADYLSKTVTEESQIETAIGGVEPLLKAFQSDTDKVRTENAALKVKVAELDKKPATGGEQSKIEPDNAEPEWFKAYKQQQDERINAIKQENDSLKALKDREDRTTLLRSLGKGANLNESTLGKILELAEEVSKDTIDEGAIKAKFAGIQTDFVTSQLEGSSSVFPLSTPESQGKEMAKAWAQDLPDKN